MSRSVCSATFATRLKIAGAARAPVFTASTVDLG